MLKAGSLFYAVAIAILFALISSSLILYSYFNSLQFQYNLQMQRMQLNATSGINLLLSKQEIIKANEKKTFDLFDGNEDPILMERKSWGAFEIGICKAFWKMDTLKQIFQMGYAIHPANRFAIYLADQIKPLSLCGKTIIKGDCYLPRAGVERAYIEGESFVGDKFIDGTVKESKKTLPAINKELIKSIGSLFSIYEGGDNSNFSLMRLADQGENPIHNSFQNKTLCLYDKNDIYLGKKSIEGNILIVSGKKIKVSADNKLLDVILAAPKIEIEEGFKGNIQAFATDTLIIGQKCQLTYPSVICVIRNNKYSPDSLLLKVGEGAEINGVLFGYQEDKSVEKLLLVQTGKHSIVTGQIYSDGSVDIKGSVYGSVICNKFIVISPSSGYENHLLNATIDNTKLSDNFISSSLIEQSENKKVAKWLY